MARIVQKSNFDKDWYNEEFILWPMKEDAAEEICEAMNKHFSHDYSDDFYKIVDDDYQLYIGMVP